MKVMLRLAAVAVLLGTTAIATSAGAQTAAVSVSNPSYFNGDGPWTLGFSFTAKQTQTVYGLGAFDFGGDGFTAAHSVGLWDNAGNLLASTAVTSSDTLVNGFRYANIGALNLTAGSIYVVGASNFGTTDAYILGGTISTAAGITYNTARYAAGNGLLNPTQVGTSGGYFGGNLLLSPLTGSVPEPATWAMLTLGFAGIGFAMRRKAKVNTRIRFA
ncbi:MAG: PEPxxWA-CTERM sorting domain-containing protein [Pseudomonadota bacterium]|jgi:hypothetical protein|nr:PEPxxWA-CTERM sorting domain-containing protein [Pseudomonadota bacterium]